MRSGIPPYEASGGLGAIGLCLDCLRLRGMYEGKEHRCRCFPTDPEWEAREWGKRDISASIDLCSLCARGTMKSGSRFTWLVCDNCRDVNALVGQALGAAGPGALPVGRHSIMNGVGLRGGTNPEAGLEDLAQWISGLVSVWMRLHEWGEDEVRRLAAILDTAGELVWLSTWQRTFPPSTGASVDAFCRFVEYDLPEHSRLTPLTAARHSFRLTDYATIRRNEEGHTGD